jgi:hypothetical protein
LSDEKQRAIPLILTGQTDREVAEGVGVSRETVTRWRNENPDFIAALNHERCQIWDATRDNVLSLVRKAVGVVGTALDQNDTRAALAILKMSGFADVEFDPKELEDNPDDILFLHCQEEVSREKIMRNRTNPEIHREDGRLWTVCSWEQKDYLRAIAKYQEKKGIGTSGDVTPTHGSLSVDCG